jgi:hypothetical protein
MLLLCHKNFSPHTQTLAYLEVISGQTNMSLIVNYFLTKILKFLQHFIHDLYKLDIFDYIFICMEIK